MSKKTEEKKGKKDDLEDEKDEAADEEEEAEGDEAGDDEADEDEGDDEEEAAAAKPVETRRAKRPAPVAHDEEEEEEEGAVEGAADGEDPSWWAPHAVLGVLVLIGVLGFFGAFNKIATKLGVKPAPIAQDTTQESKPVTGSPTPAPQPMPPNPHLGQGPDQAQQPPREMFGAKHLLVMYKGSMRAPATITRTKDEAKTRAAEADKKAKDGKTPFEDLVKEYSDEPGAGARGGDLGRFPKGSMVPEFQNALEKIKVGEVSDVVETPFGFHVIKRTQ